MLNVQKRLKGSPMLAMNKENHIKLISAKLYFGRTHTAFKKQDLKWIESK